MKTNSKFSFIRGRAREVLEAAEKRGVEVTLSYTTPQFPSCGCSLHSFAVNPFTDWTQLNVRVSDRENPSDYISLRVDTAMTGEPSELYDAVEYAMQCHDAVAGKQDRVRRGFALSERTVLR